MKISFQHWTINFSTEKLIYISKEIEESVLEICVILAIKLKKKIWENSEEVKILWTRQTNLTSTTSINSILKEYQDFTKLFTKEALERTLLTY